jgi:hypothetical protein
MFPGLFGIKIERIKKKSTIKLAHRYVLYRAFRRYWFNNSLSVRIIRIKDVFDKSKRPYEKKGACNLV